MGLLEVITADRLANCSGAELVAALRAVGVAVHGATVTSELAAVEVEPSQGPAAEAVMRSHVPTAPYDPLWVFASDLPSGMRVHAGHLRDFEQAVRSGTPVTNTQTLHVIADIIAWIRLSEDRL